MSLTFNCRLVLNCEMWYAETPTRHFTWSFLARSSWVRCTDVLLLVSFTLLSLCITSPYTVPAHAWVISLTEVDKDLSNHTFAHDWKSNKNSNLPKTRKCQFRLCPNVCRCLCSDCLHPCPRFRHVENHAQGRGQITTPAEKWEKLLAAESWSMCFTFAYLLANVKLGTHLAAQRKVECYIWTCFRRKYFRSLHETATGTREHQMGTVEGGTKIDLPSSDHTHGQPEHPPQLSMQFFHECTYHKICLHNSCNGAVSPKPKNSHD